MREDAETPGGSIARQAEFYDRRWADHTFADGLKLRRCVAILRAIAEADFVRPRVLELGSGTGWLTAILGQFGPATGVELSPRAVAAASRRYPHVQFLQADLGAWDHPRGQFDVVVSHEVIEHLEDQGAHLAMAHGLLRRGGLLVLTTPNARTVEAMPDDQRAAWCNQPIERWLTAPQLRRLARAHGFRVRSLSTLVAGFGVRGAYRALNSTKVSALLGRAGLAGAYDALRLHAGFGLHLILSAEKL